MRTCRPVRASVARNDRVGRDAPHLAFRTPSSCDRSGPSAAAVARGGPAGGTRTPSRPLSLGAMTNSAPDESAGAYAASSSWLGVRAAHARESARRGGAFVVREELRPACLGDLVLHRELGPSVLDEPRCDRENAADR
jgi:hypothetical protein